MSIASPLSKVGLEIYTTEPIEEEEEEEKKEDSEETTEEDAEEETGVTFPEFDNKIVYQNGETIQIDYLGELYSDSFEMDYGDISSNSNVSVPIETLNYFFKGRKVALKKAWQNGTLKWDDMDTAILGFVTEINYNQDKIDVKIGGMDKLLEAEATFDFTQMKRSEIVKQIIEAAGLKAKVDATGLIDDVIDFKTTSSSGGGDEESGDAPGIGNAKIDDLVKKWVKGKKSALEKAKAIHAGLRDEVGIVYSYYYNSHYHTPENCLAHVHSPGLNCGDTAILTTACMKSGGLNAYIVLRCDSAHFFTVIEIGGTKYYSDLTGSEGARSVRAWNDTWQHNKCGNKYDLS